MTGPLPRRDRILRIFLAAVAVSAVMRLVYIGTFNHTPLAGDAPGFVHYAQAMKDFYGYSAREPFWILWVKCWIAPFKHPKTGIRLSAVFSYCVSAVFLFLVARKYLGELAALTGGIFYLLVPYSFFSNLRAHRLEFYLMLLLIFTYILMKGLRRRRDAFLAGAVSSALILTRMESATVVFAGFLFYLLTDGTSLETGLKRTAAAAAVTLFLTGPFFAVCWLKAGSPLSVLNNHAKFYDSHEHAGIPGHRPASVALAHPYGGDRETVTEYIFSGRSPDKIIFMFLRGYEKTLTRGLHRLMLFQLDMRSLVFPVWAGLILMLFTAGTRKLLFWGLLFIFPHAFILGLHVVGKPSVDIRLAASSLPLDAFAFASLVFFLIRAGNYFVNHKKTTSPPGSGRLLETIS